MFSRHTRLAAAALIAALSLTTLSALAEPPVGDYKSTVERNDRTFTSTISISKNDKGMLVGKWITQRGESDLKDIKYDAEKHTIAFSRTQTRQNGEESTSTFTGKIEAGNLTGTMTSPRGDREFTATLVSPAEKLIGEWEITQTFGEREFTSTVNFATAGDKADKLTGKWVTQRGESDLSDIKVEGDTVSFTRTIQFQDNSFTTNFTGKLEGDKLVGTMSSQRGDNPATFTRKAQPENADSN